MSAPIAWIAKIESPELILPPTTIVPSKISLTSATKANGDNSPVCPPAPLQTNIKPSTPASIAFFEWYKLMTSEKTNPPYLWTFSTTSLGLPSEVITIGG